MYDLLWYLSDREWPAPNLGLLNNALKQTNWTGSNVTAENWRAIVRAQIESSSWDQVLDDVRPFLAAPQESQLLTKENLLRLLA